MRSVGTGSSEAQLWPLYWSSPTAAPVVLNESGLSGSVQPEGINASGAIVGTANSGTNVCQAIEWSSPTATPVILPGAGGGSNMGQAASRIVDTGEVFGGAPQQALAWAPGATAPTDLNLPAGYILQGGYAVGQETGDIGSTALTATLQTVGFYWAPPTFAYQQVAVPAGFTKTTFLLGIGKSHFGVGYYSNGSTASAAIWPTLSTPFVDVNTLVPTGTTFYLETVEFVTDSGVLIGLGHTQSGSQLVWYMVQPN